MLRLTFISIGRTSESWVKEGTDKYLRLLGKYCKTEWIELPDVKNAAKMDPSILRKAEAELLLNNIPERAYPVFLDEKGRKMSSEVFAGFLQKTGDMHSHIAFVIGGSYGLEPHLSESGDSISLSAMTFTHQMVRVILCEQIFRAFTILKGTGYHH